MLAPRHLWTLLAAPLAALAVHAQGQVFVVDAAGGPGSFSTQLQPAIDAASPGDTLLVRSGNYAAASLVGKPLTLIADTGADVYAQWLQIQQLPAGAGVVVHGLRFGWVHAEFCSGPLWFERCAMIAPSINGALSLFQCADIVLNECEVKGACVQDITTLHKTVPALTIEGAELFASASSFLGSDGCPFGPDHLPKAGSSGVLLKSGSAWFAGCVLHGGDSGTSGAGCDPLGGFAPGGDGASVSAGAALYTLDCVADGGVGFLCTTPFSAPPLGGLPYDVAAGAQHAALAGASCAWAVESPVREFQLVKARLVAEPGALVFLAVSLEPEGFYFDAFQGPQLVAFPWFGVVLGTVPAGGGAQYQFPFGALPPGIDAQPFYSQTAVLGASGLLQVCGGSTFHVLDQAL